MRAELVGGELKRVNARRRRRGPSPVRVAVLSFVVPGLGHFAQGRISRGVLLMIPTLVLVAAIGAMLLRGPSAALGALLRPDFVLALVGLDLLVLASRLVAILDAFVAAEHRAVTGVPYRPLSIALVAALLVGTLTVQGAVAGIGYQAYTTLDTVFAEGAAPEWSIPKLATPTLLPGAVATASPSPTPVPEAAWKADGRLNLLLIGSDAGPGRFSLRTDTIEVLSVDVKTSHAVLFGIPRNLVNVPLADESAAAFPNGRFPQFIFGLYVYAMQHPEYFPGGDARGFRAVSGAVQQLLGIPLDGAVVVSLNGFVRLVDALGGLWIDVPTRLTDDRYPLENGSGYVRLDIKAGCRHLTGHFALAYARSRHQDSDYGRMRRQQAVLIALAHQVDPLGLLAQAPELLDIAKDNLWMTLQPEDMASLAQLAVKVEPSKVRTLQFNPPTYPEYLTTATIKKIRTAAGSVFTNWTTSTTPTASPTPTRPPCGP